MSPPKRPDVERGIVYHENDQTVNQTSFPVSISLESQRLSASFAFNFIAEGAGVRGGIKQEIEAGNGEIGRRRPATR